MQTNRLRFVDVDNSASLPQPSAITGYAVIKAPKGTTKPQYIGATDVDSIIQLFGTPSSSYPSIQEIIDFNQQYGIWVSAPGGVDADNDLYSYYGGVYITNLASVEPFYKVTEGVDGEPDLTIMKAHLIAGNNASAFSTGSSLALFGTGAVTVDNIPESSIDTAKTSGMMLTFNRSDGTVAEIPMSFSGTDITCVNPSGGAVLTIGTISAGSRMNTKKVQITGSNLYQNGVYYDLEFGSSTPRAYFNNRPLAEYLTVVIPDFVWDCDISDMVTMAFYQSSPRAVSGTFVVSNVDKYMSVYNTYDMRFTFTGTGSQTGTVTLCGKTISISPAITSADELVTKLATTVIPGYTISRYAAGVLSVINNSPAFAPAEISNVSITGYSCSRARIGIGTAMANPTFNTITFSYSELVRTGVTYSKSYTVSPDFSKVDGFGNNIFADTTLEGNPFIKVKSFSPLYNINGDFPATSTILTGTRAVSNAEFDSAKLSTVLQAGWDKASGDEYQDVKIFIEPECQSSLATTLANYRSGMYSFSTFVTGIKVPNGVTSTSSEVIAATNALATARATYPNVTGLAYYCNEFKVKENYSGTEYWTIPLGSVASMLAQIMEKRLGGVAPMFTNENQLGGQISKSVKRQKYSFDAGSLDTLDTVGLNPIILDSFYGLMITSQRTAQSPMTLTDWSYLGHQMSFDLFRDEIKKGVMIPQIGKMIDSTHMALRREQAQIILNKRLTGPTTIWSEGKVYVEEVNTAETKAQNLFLIKVRVKVNPFSEYVELIFQNEAQSTTIA